MHYLQTLFKFACVLCAFFITASQVHATAITFDSQIDVIIDTDPSAEFFDFGVGTVVTGSIDDQTFDGQITVGTETVTFGCCVAAGGLSVSNNDQLDAETAALLNSLAGIPLYSEGDFVDGINIEGDVILPSGNRMEVGISYVFDACTFDDDSLANYPFDMSSLRVALFFILEEEDEGGDIYESLGKIFSSDHTDGDSDGVTDCSDNCSGAPNTDQRDTDGDDIGNVCDADIALPNDCIVNFLDLNTMKTAFFSSPGQPGWNEDADLDGDDSVNFADLIIMKDMFFGSPGPSGVPNACTQ